METQNRKFFRGQIYYVNEDLNCPSIGSEMWSNRYALIVSNNTNNKYSDVVEIVYITSSRKHKHKPLPTQVLIQTGVHTISVAQCEHIYSVDISRLGSFLRTITLDEQSRINQALSISLNLINSEHPQSLFKKWESNISRWGLQDSFKENTTDNDTKSMIKSLQKERDSYKALYEELSKKIDQVKTML